MLEIRIAGLRAEVYPAENPRYRSRLLLVHGLWAGSWCWRPFGSFLAHRGWEVLAVDLRGRPGSRAAPLAEVTVEDYREDLAGVLASDELAPGPERDSTIVIGHDLGGLLGLGLAGDAACRAAVALAPPLRPALTRDYRRALRGRWFRRTLGAPVEPVDDRPPAGGVLQDDSSRVGKAILGGGIARDRADVPSLVVAGERDRWIDPRALESAARELGCDFLARPAGHWGLDGGGFERHVDQIHRWIIRRLGPDLLRLTGYEDLEEEGGDS